MRYQSPTLFGMAYASRLFREVENPLRFEELRRQTQPALDLQNPANGHAQALLDWLNKWGCRISKKSFPTLSLELRTWFNEWKHKLPCDDLELVDTSDRELDVVANAYGALLGTSLGQRPTPATKILFVIRPEVAIPWDKPIRVQFNVKGSRSDYREMLAISKQEAEMLVADAARYGVADRQNIPCEVGSPRRTLAKLLDEYHWITITRRHVIPSRDELKQWINLVGL